MTAISFGNSPTKKGTSQDGETKPNNTEQTDLIRGDVDGDLLPRPRLRPMEHHRRRKTHRSAPDLVQKNQCSTPTQRHEGKATYNRENPTTSMYREASGTSPPPTPAGSATRKARDWPGCARETLKVGGKNKGGEDDPKTI
jgi:hypothetical protein